MGQIRVFIQDTKMSGGRVIRKGTACMVEDESTEIVEISIDVHFFFYLDRSVFLSSTRLISP